MKKIYFFSLALLITLGANSQVEYGIFAGWQTTTAHYTIEDKEQTLNIKQANNFKDGYQAGVMLKVPFDNRLFFAPAVFYSLKGYKVTYNMYSIQPDARAKDNNTTLQTMELAALLQYDIGGRPSHFFIKAGPSFDIQLYGKETFNLSTGGSVSRKMAFGFAEYGRYAVNLIGQLGFETRNGFSIFGHFTRGVISINNADNGPSIDHVVYGFSIGKLLNRKK